MMQQSSRSQAVLYKYTTLENDRATGVIAPVLPLTNAVAKSGRRNGTDGDRVGDYGYC